MNNPAQSSINASTESVIHGRLNDSSNNNPESLDSQPAISMQSQATQFQTTQFIELMKQEAQKNQSNGNTQKALINFSPLLFFPFPPSPAFVDGFKTMKSC